MSYNIITKKYDGYIYKIYNDVNDKIYIGQTIRDIKIRWRQHLYYAKRNDVSHGQIIYCDMYKYGVEHYNIEIIKCVSHDDRSLLKNELNELEIKYIKKYNSLIPNGYNVSPGGSNIGSPITYPVKAYDASGNICYEFDSICEASASLNIDVGKIGRNCSGKSQFANGYIWRYKNDSFDKYDVLVDQNTLDLSAHRITIDKYDINSKKLIGSYSSVAEALRSINKYQGGTPIKNCLNNIQNSAYGYVWRYSNQSFDSRKTGNIHEKAVDVYDLNKQYIGSFKSISSALSTLGLNDNIHSNVVNCCVGKVKTASGYIWRYKGDKLEKYNTTKKTRAIQINQYSKDNVFISSYESATYICNLFGYCRGTIIDCCKHRIEECYGYKWFYAKDPDQPDKTKILSE